MRPRTYHGYAGPGRPAPTGGFVSDWWQDFSRGAKYVGTGEWLPDATRGATYITETVAGEEAVELLQGVGQTALNPSDAANKGMNRVSDQSIGYYDRLKAEIKRIWRKYGIPIVIVGGVSVFLLLGGTAFAAGRIIRGRRRNPRASDFPIHALRGMIAGIGFMAGPVGWLALTAPALLIPTRTWRKILARRRDERLARYRRIRSRR